MTKAEKIESLQNCAYNAQAIYVALVLSGESDDPKKQKAQDAAKQRREELIQQIEELEKNETEKI